MRYANNQGPAGGKRTHRGHLRSIVVRVGCEFHGGTNPRKIRCNQMNERMQPEPM
jgi:hypothetical protein